MPTKITVNDTFVGEVYIGSIKKVLSAGQSVIIEDSAAQTDEIKKLVSKKIIKTSSPDEPDQAIDKMAISPTENFRVKNLTGRNLSIQGVREMLVPNGAIFIDYQTLVSGFIGVLIKSGIAEIFDVNGNQIVLDDATGFKKVAPQEENLELPTEIEAEEDIEVSSIESENVEEDKIELGKIENKISLKSAADVKEQVDNDPKSELLTKDEFGDTVIDPLLKEKHTSYVWDAEAQENKKGKPVFDYDGEDDNHLPDDGSAVVMPNKKLSIKSKNDVVDALNPNSPKKASIKSSEETETSSDKPAKKSSKKKTKKKTTKKKTTKKKTSKRRKVAQKDSIDKVVDKIKKQTKNKKLSIKAVGQEKKEALADEVSDEVILHNKNESIFVDQQQESERINQHPILRNRNNEDIE